MDDYEFSEVKGPRRRKKPAGRVWNILTILVLIGVLCIISVFFLIYFNPNIVLNPFPPPTFNPLLATPTITVTPRFTLVPSWTPTNVIIQATETPTAGPTHTPLVTPISKANPTIEPTSVSLAAFTYAFGTQLGSPVAIDGAQFHPDAGCTWSGVAGQATSLNDEGVKGLFVQLGGGLPGVESTGNLTMTGLAPQYGEGGFEITISDKVTASTGSLWIQLLDQQNLPLSDRVYFDTYDDCTKNLIIIYFDQVR